MGKCFSSICNFLINNNEQQYTILKTYKQNDYKFIYLTIDKKTNLKYIVKKNKKKSFYNEIYILNKICKLKNKHIVNFYKNPDINNYLIFFEYAYYGDLFEIYTKNKNISMTTSINIFRIIINTLYIVNNKYKISHRDIKLENIVLDHNGIIKIIDWGSSGADNISKIKVGTVNYRAPELINNCNYIGQFIDVWACGVLLFVMICGILPMTENKKCRWRYNIYNYNWKIYWPNIEKYIDNNISINFKKIIEQMLYYDLNKRITLEKINNNSWINHLLLNNLEIKKNLIS